MNYLTVQGLAKFIMVNVQEYIYNVPLNNANNQQCNHKKSSRHEEEGEEQTCNYSTHIPFSNFSKS